MEFGWVARFDPCHIDRHDPATELDRRINRLERDRLGLISHQADDEAGVETGRRFALVETGGDRGKHVVWGQPARCVEQWREPKLGVDHAIGG